MNKYNWKGIKFPAEPKEWKKFERNNKAIALIIYTTQQKNNKGCIQIRI